MLCQLDSLSNLQVLIRQLHLGKYQLVMVLDYYYQLSNNVLWDKRVSSMSTQLHLLVNHLMTCMFQQNIDQLLLHQLLNKNQTDNRLEKSSQPDIVGLQLNLHNLMLRFFL